MDVNSRTVTVGQYLGIRLRQLQVGVLFGLPGDFNLGLLDQLLSVDGLEWVGSTNELNAAYAADAYARVSRGLGAVVTTYGVGELSAVNGIAGAYAEDVPVVKITGVPTTTAHHQHNLLHHSLMDGDYEHFFRIFKEITAASAILRADNAASEIDRVLLTALTESKPVYLAIPADVAESSVSAASLRIPLVPRSSDATAVERFERALQEALAAVEEIVVLAGVRVHRRNLEEELLELSRVPGVLIAAQSASKAVIDESSASSLGTYMGKLSPSALTREKVDQAEPLILIGALMSDLLTGGFTHEFEHTDCIELGLLNARIGSMTFHNVHLQNSLAALTRIANSLDLIPVRPIEHPPLPTSVTDDGHLTQASFWATIESWLPSDSIVIAEAGTSFYGAIGMNLPDRCDLLGQPIWSAIGYTIPATLGASLADPSCRMILFIGDGAAQLTVQELATILDRGLNPVIFVLNNHGYTVERVIRNPQAQYHDITEWEWTALPAALAPHALHVATRVETHTELAAALAVARETTDRMVLIEVNLDPADSPQLLSALGAMLNKANTAD